MSQYQLGERSAGYLIGSSEIGPGRGPPGLLNRLYPINLRRTPMGDALERSSGHGPQAAPSLRRRMTEVMEQPGPPDGWKREARCLALQCDAELSRLHGQSDPDAWMAATEARLELSMPYRSAYCRFRWAESMLET